MKRILSFLNAGILFWPSDDKITKFVHNPNLIHKQHSASEYAFTKKKITKSFIHPASFVNRISSTLTVLVPGLPAGWRARRKRADLSLQFISQIADQVLK